MRKGLTEAVQLRRDRLAATKWCSGCQQEVPLVNFYNDKTTADRLCPKCKTCVKERRNITRLPSRYGITNEEYAHMLCDQGDACFLCGRQAGTTKSTKLHVDHDHTTGKVRSLLCLGCNILVGFLEKDPVRAELAREYIHLHAGPPPSRGLLDPHHEKARL